MSSKLLINVNDASIVVPDTGDDTPSGAGTPDTGGNTILAGTNYANDNGTSMVLPVLGISLLVLLIITAIITTTIRRHKTNKAGKFSINNTKRLIAKVTTLSAVILLVVFSAANLNDKQEKVGAVEIIEDSSLSITVDDVNIDVDLDDENVYAMAESVVTIDTATKAGYILMAYIDSSTTTLTNSDSSSTIKMINSTEPHKLTENTWGMATVKPTSQNDEVFMGLPTSEKDAFVLESTRKGSEAGKETTLYYGTYITPDTDFGTYEGVTINYIAVATMCNPEATNIEETVCLQDFAGPNRDQIIDSMVMETQYTLFDRRDEKAYTVAKLRTDPYTYDTDPIDHYAVWMTQNLDLNLDSRTTYTNEDTDLGYNPQTGRYETASWRPERSTVAPVGGWDASDLENYWIRDDFHPVSYDPGDYYWNGQVSSGSDWYEYWEQCYWSVDNYCASIDPASKYVADNGLPQYHLGNFYNWAAAVASNDSSADFGSYNGYTAVEQSICPAGWTLPTAGRGEDSFGEVWNQYGYDAVVLKSSPTYYSLGGYFSGRLGSVGTYIGYWTSVPESGADRIRFSGIDVGGDVYGAFYASDGLPVRCVARPVSTDVYLY